MVSASADAETIFGSESQKIAKKKKKKKKRPRVEDENLENASAADFGAPAKKKKK